MLAWPAMVESESSSLGMSCNIMQLKGFLQTGSPKSDVRSWALGDYSVGSPQKQHQSSIILIFYMCSLPFIR